MRVMYLYCKGIKHQISASFPIFKLVRTQHLRFYIYLKDHLHRTKA